MAGVLKGIKVIEVAAMAAAPSAAVVLADMGAEVIKIEPSAGDLWRYGHKIVPLPPSDIAYTTYMQNRSKQSVVLNLNHEEARQALYKLAATADVFLTNSPRQVQEKLKHTYEDIKAVNPQIVFASINGFGQFGPDKDAPGYDATALYARTGLMDEIRPKDSDPAVLPPSAGDMATAMSLYSAIMTGLFHRERTGQGSKVSTSLMSNGLWINSTILQSTLVGAPPLQKFHREEWPNPVVAANYKTRDGRYVMIVELNPANFNACLDALGAEHLKGDERFSTPLGRHQNSAVLLAEFQRIIGAHDLAAVTTMLTKGGVNYSVMQTTEEATRDEHIIANGCYPEVDGADGIRTVDSPIYIEAAGVEKATPRRPPSIGEHTTTVLESLGYSKDQLADMAQAGAISLHGGQNNV